MALRFILEARASERSKTWQRMKYQNISMICPQARKSLHAQ
jgi:hypothetical protein